MNGFSRLALLLLAYLLRGLAWLPFNTAKGLHRAATWLERKAEAPQRGGRFVP